MHSHTTPERKFKLENESNQLMEDTHLVFEAERFHLRERLTGSDCRLQKRGDYLEKREVESKHEDVL